MRASCARPCAAGRAGGPAPLISCPIVRGWRVFPVLPLSACAALMASGCGAARQDAHEANGSFTIKVLASSFPQKQAIARPARFALRVENAGTHTAPNVAV